MLALSFLLGVLVAAAYAASRAWNAELRTGSVTRPATILLEVVCVLAAAFAMVAFDRANAKVFLAGVLGFGGGHLLTTSAVRKPT